MDVPLLSEQAVKKRKTIIDEQTLDIIEGIRELRLFNKKLPDLINGSIRISEPVLTELSLFLNRKYDYMVKQTNIGHDDEVIKSLAILINALIDGKRLDEVYCYKLVMNNLVKFLSLTGLSDHIKDLIASVCETFLVISMDFVIDSSICTCTLKYLLYSIVDDTKIIHTEHVLRLWKIKNLIKDIDFTNNSDEELKHLFFKVLVRPKFVDNEEGQMIVSYVLLNPTISLKSMQTNIYKVVNMLSESQDASVFGEIYFNAWNLAEPTLREQIEKICIQDMMERVLTSERDGLNMTSWASKVLTVLFALRKKNIYKLNITLTKLYQPFLWRYLQSNISHERCNAAEVLCASFPLMVPGEVRVVLSSLREKQVRLMFDLLEDACSNVRIIALKGVCQCLTHRIDYFGDEHVTQFVEIILQKLAYDKIPEVRAGVFNGMETMTTKPQSAIILIKELAKMRQHMRDENEKVRSSFLSFLIKMKENLSMPFNFWKIFPLREQISLLINDTSVIAKLVAKFIIDFFYNKKHCEEVIFSRLVKLTNINVRAPRLLFIHAEGLINSADAFTIISCIINKLYALHGTQIKQDTGNINPGQNLEDADIKNIFSKLDDDKDVLPASEDIACLTNEPRIISGLILSASALFGVFKNNLLNNDQYEDKLYGFSLPFIKRFIQMYKESQIYYAVMTYASNIPLAKLGPTCNLAENCMTELKQINEKTPVYRIQALTNCLSCWDRNEDLFSLIISWLDNPLKCKNLKLLKTESCKTGNAKGFKLTIALRLLDCIFDESCRQYELSVSSCTLFHLHCCLNQVKELIVIRSNEGSAVYKRIDPILNHCYKTLITVQCYVPTTCSLDETSSEEKSFVAHHPIKEHVKWLKSYIAKSFDVPTKSVKNCINCLPMSCLIVFLSMVKKHLLIQQIADNEYIEAVADLVLHCLNFECRYLLLEASAELLKDLSEHCELHNDGSKPLQPTNALDQLLTKILAVLKEGDFTAQTLLKYCE
ncbi:condensin-2 complex subunit G2-like isoform X2 [Rhodnius prolixus]